MAIPKLALTISLLIEEKFRRVRNEATTGKTPRPKRVPSWQRIRTNGDATTVANTAAEAFLALTSMTVLPNREVDIDRVSD
jgi:hypothetical protein